MSREYGGREAAMLRDARRLGWREDVVFELSVRISEEMEGTLRRLRELSVRRVGR